MSNIQNDNFQEQNPDTDINDPAVPEPEEEEDYGYQEDEVFPNGDSEEELRQERLYQENYEN